MATLFTLAFALGGWRAGLSRLNDNSFLWHLQTGHWILEHGVPRTDLYSFTAPDVSWIAQSWLAEVLYAVFDRLFGPFGVRVLGGVVGAIVGVLGYRLALRLARDRLRALLVAVGAVGSSFTLWTERPLFLGLLAFMGLLWIVEAPDSAIGRRPLLTVPPLLWLWANVHGTFALGFAYLGLHLLGRWVDRAPPWRGRELVLAKSMAFALVATLVNPYGVRMLLFPFDLLSRGDILKHVVEWSSPDFRSAPGLMLAVWVAVFVGCVALGSHRPSKRDVIVSVPFLVMALWAERNIALSPLVGMAVAARCIAADHDRPDVVGPVHRVLAVLVIGMTLLMTVNAASEPDFDFRAYPVGAMEALAKEGLLGRRLLTDDASAGYVIQRWWPRQKVFADDRYDMYPPRIMYDLLRITNVEAGWERVLTKYDIEVVVWARGHPITEVLARDPGWRRIHRDRVSDTYLRR